MLFHLKCKIPLALFFPNPEQGASSGSSTGIAQRARHPDELKRDDGTWMIDIDYYLSQQIHPVVSRLCASIQGTSPERLADCLGLDSSKVNVLLLARLEWLWYFPFLRIIYTTIDGFSVPN